MSVQKSKKNVPIYFYYLAISKQKDSTDESVYDMKQIVEAFSKLLPYIMKKELPNRKKDNTASEKVVWLASYEDLKNGNYNLIFKSAKYNHVRNEIDTETMKEYGTRKRPQDGDEEKTHLRSKQIEAVLALLEEGATIPFIARYRKEVTGNLDEEQIRNIVVIYEYEEKLAKTSSFLFANFSSYS